jgi:hypothetical protein
MKVQGPSSTAAAQAARRAAGYVAPGFVLPTNEASAVQSPVQTSSAATLSSVGALLALQVQDDVGERRRRATQRSNNLLNQLDGIRVAILSGGVSRAQVNALAATLRDTRDAVDDPALDAILDDVELRAEVELAKLERAL